MTRPTVSVVIPTRDKADSLRLVLTCLARQVCPQPHEIVVVDDGCTDGTPTWWLPPPHGCPCARWR
ncbi:hypothetical protein BM536_035910, partial [Streptomyces phaeoluteigriseus]